MKQEAPETLHSAIIYFSDPDRCFHVLLWPLGETNTLAPE